MRSSFLVLPRIVSRSSRSCVPFIACSSAEPSTAAPPPPPDGAPWKAGADLRDPPMRPRTCLGPMRRRMPPPQTRGRMLRRTSAMQGAPSTDDASTDDASTGDATSAAATDAGTDSSTASDAGPERGHRPHELHQSLGAVPGERRRLQPDSRPNLATRSRGSAPASFDGVPGWTHVYTTDGARPRDDRASRGEAIVEEAHVDQTAMYVHIARGPSTGADVQQTVSLTTAPSATSSGPAASYLLRVSTNDERRPDRLRVLEPGLAGRRLRTGAPGCGRSPRYSHHAGAQPGAIP